MPPQPTTAAARKAMRKGTRSCYECRKRKVRCIFSKDSIRCDGCAARDKQCMEQRRELLQASAIETKESLRDRVARLEATIQALSNGAGAGSGSELMNQTPNRLQVDQQDKESYRSRLNSSSSSIIRTPSPTSASSPNASVSVDNGPSQNIDPIVTLFDNTIWRRHSSEVGQEHISKIDEAGNSIAATKRIRTCELLLADLLPPDLLSMVMSATCAWWHTWRPLGPWLPVAIASEKDSTLPDFIFWTLKSADPSIISLGMLCVAVCLQQLESRVHQYIIRQLPRLPGELFQEYFEKVNRFIINDSDYASTEEGIEALMFSAKIYMNLGLQRQCWVLTHQAIAYAQLLGYHRPERLSARETEVERHRRVQSWLSLCTGDVYSSLLLGLPYAANGRTIPLTQSQRSTTSLFQHNLILLSARVIDRNQMGLSLSSSYTEEIQKEIETATKSLDEAFWNAPDSLSGGKITRHEYLEQVSAQCWFYQLLVLLHMPLMIHSVEDARLEKHRIACLQASRNWLKIYHIMRSDPYSAFGMVKLIDYQAFICSALLMLGLLGYGSSTHKHTNRDKDRELIRLTITTLRQASGTVNNPIATEAVQGLQTLLMLDGGCPHENGVACNNAYAKISVPYVGVITISPGEFFTTSRPTSMSPSNNPSLEFSLSHEVSMGNSGPANQSLEMPSDSAFNGGQASGLAFSDNIESELASIDFDWASTFTTTFEDDWAWLNEVSF